MRRLTPNEPADRGSTTKYGNGQIPEIKHDKEMQAHSFKKIPK